MFKRKPKEQPVIEEDEITEEEMEKARGFSRQVKRYIIRHDKKEMADGSGMIKES
ncbi:MAG: hypothetical protein WC455_09870 [Dehalococcoidia bacterium]|jgi:hypothetical protein